MGWVLIVQPIQDYITRLQSEELSKVVRGSHSSFVIVKDTEPEHIYGAIRKYNPKVIYLGGHGSRDRWYKLNDFNVSMLKNRIVYAYSCETAYKLGINAVKDGAEAYLGYASSYLVPEISHTREFVRIGLKPLEYLLQGKSAGETFTLTQKDYREFMYGLDENDREAMLHNLKSFRLIGDWRARAF